VQKAKSTWQKQAVP